MKRKHAIRPLSVVSLTLTYLLIAVLLAFALIPIIYVIGLSFSPGSTLYMDTIFPANPTLDNYKTLIYDTQFPRWYLNTIIAGLFTSVATLVLSAPTAYAFSRLRFRGRKPFLMVLLVLQMFPGMMAMVAYYVLLNMVGLLDTTAGLVILYSGAAVTGNTWLLKSFYDTVPKALEESAMIDGANRFQVFFKILLPLSYPMLVLVGVFAFAAPFGDFVLSRIVLTRPENYTLALGTYNFIASDFGNNFTVFAASSVLASLPITILYLSLQKTMVSGFKGAVVR
jgi:arabinogalactan oligomer/maltooligosaccharide transport system permease protein